MVWQQDASGAVIFANERWFEFTRLPRERRSLEREAWRQIVHPEDFARVVQTMADALAQQAPYDVEYRARPIDGDAEAYQWFSASACPRFEVGRFDGYLGSVVSIHDARKREEAERALREEATRRLDAFRALGEAVPQIVWTADATGALDWYNQRWYTYTGQTPEEALGWGWQAVQHPEDFPVMFAQWTRALETGERAEMEFRLRGRDGTFRWFLTLINPLKDEHGNVIRWFGTNTDIHEQKTRVERSKRIAQTLQELFSPEKLPSSDDLAFDALYVAAESDALVGGDWYDAFALPAERICVSIGDVAGHGLDAAVIAGRLRQTIFSEALTDDDPGAILRKADVVLRAQSQTIATALVAIIDVAAGVMTYASAGHPPPIVAAGTAHPAFLRDGAAPLGSGFVAGGLATETHTYRLTPNSLIVLYTDGITEFGRDIVAGETTLLEAVHALSGVDAAFSARDLYTRVIGDQLTTDDIAVMLVHWRPIAHRSETKPDVPAKRWRFHSSHAISAQSARHEMMSFIRAHAAAGEDTFTAEIVIGELLANTVEHAPGFVEIGIDWPDTGLLISVCDAGPGFAVDEAQLPASPYAESGRGMFLVRALSTAVQVRPARGFGTEVVVTLTLARATA